MIKNDSVLCACCGREFTMPLVEMVRRKHRWCDSCIGIADQRLSEAVIRALQTTSEMYNRSVE